MTTDERLHIIGEFIRRSDEEFGDGGNNLIAAELSTPPPRNNATPS